MAVDWRGHPPRTLGAQIRKMAELEAWGAVVTGAQGSSPQHVISVGTLIAKWEKTYGHLERALSWSTAPKLAAALALGVIPMDITCLVRRSVANLPLAPVLPPDGRLKLCFGNGPELDRRTFATSAANPCWFL